MSVTSPTSSPPPDQTPSGVRSGPELAPCVIQANVRGGKGDSCSPESVRSHSAPLVGWPCWRTVGARLAHG
jgi:hypothetical protein